MLYTRCSKKRLMSWALSLSQISEHSLFINFYTYKMPFIPKLSKNHWIQSRQRAKYIWTTWKNTLSQHTSMVEYSMKNNHANFKQSKIHVHSIQVWSNIEWKITTLISGNRFDSHRKQYSSVIAYIYLKFFSSIILTTAFQLVVYFSAR